MFGEGNGDAKEMSKEMCEKLSVLVFSPFFPRRRSVFEKYYLLGEREGGHGRCSGCPPSHRRSLTQVVIQVYFLELSS